MIIIKGRVTNRFSTKNVKLTQVDPRPKDPSSILPAYTLDSCETDKQIFTGVVGTIRGLVKPQNTLLAQNREALSAKIEQARIYQSHLALTKKCDNFIKHLFNILLNITVLIVVELC